MDEAQCEALAYYVGGSLNVIGPHKLTGNGTIGRCGFVGVGVTCWRKCVTVEAGFEVSYMFKPHPVFQFTSSCCLSKM